MWHTEWTATYTVSYTSEAIMAPTESVKDAAEPPMIIATAAPLHGPLRVIVVGAGGTGARVVPPLAQMLRPGDSMVIVDHDIVEDRNLARQHFSERDIGRHKALVLSERYQRQGISVQAYAHQLQPATNSGFITSLPNMRGLNAQIVVGCVDNWHARKAIQDLVTRLPIAAAWIDVGNETRGGQVLMSLRAWMVRHSMGQVEPSPIFLNAMLAMPQLLRAQPWKCIPCGIQNAAGAATCQGCKQPEASCGQQVDMQTVMVNHMAACSAINCVSWLMLGIPFTSCGAFFSTLNTMQPIRLREWLPSSRYLVPDTTFAIAE